MANIFGDNSDGFANENEIIDYLNTQKLYDNLNTNMKEFLSFLFSTDLKGSKISAFKPTGMVKPDVAITINGITKYVSVKKGSGNSVHQEQLSLFEMFLKSNSVTPQIITYLKEFHYGDGSTDGSGSTRVSASDWLSNNNKKMIEINKAFKDECLLKKVFDRVLFVGNVSPAPVVDSMFHGNVERALWASREEITNYLLKVNNTSSTIHFSNLTYQVWNRNLNFNPDTANRRHVMQMKWASLTDDLALIKRLRK